MTRLRGQRGSVTPMLVILVVSLLAVSGLAYDGSQILAARRQAADVAAQAAQAGTSGVHTGVGRAGSSGLSPAASTAAAHTYLAGVGHSGTVTVTGGQVQVTVAVSVSMTLLSAVGIGPRTVTGTSSSRLVRGDTTGDS